MNLFVEKWKQLRPYGADCQVSSESMVRQDHGRIGQITDGVLYFL